MKKCKYCAEEIQDDAVKCKHCGEFLNKDEKKNQNEINNKKLKSFRLGKYEPPTTKDGKKKGSCGNIVAAIIILTIGIAVATSILSEDDTSGNSTNKKDNGNVAAICAQNYVKALLKSPGSAKFPWDLKSTPLGGNKYEVINYVDSQNSFGALIRTNYKCQVTVVDASNFQCDTSCEVY